MNSDIKLLVVDDVEQNLIAIEALLARPGLTILKASSGAEALEILLTEEVALALLDVQMPEMDGFELAELLRGSSRTCTIPLIFLTAASRDPSRTFQGYEAGAVDFLHKPIDGHVLRSKVEVFVELHAQRKQLSEQLEQLKQSLHLNEMFIAVLGHDLRNPLSAMLNYTEVITSLCQEGPVQEAAARIKASGMRMTGMIGQLLDLARVRSGEFSLNPKFADLHQLCVAIKNEFDRPGLSPRIELERLGDVEGLFDEDLLSQVVSNLVGNALQHGARDGVVSVVVDGSSSDVLRVKVHNRGAIPAEIAATIFEPFSSGRPESRVREGLGLGLYIVKQFVQAHGGRVDLTSNEQDGTCFQFIIPRSQLDALSPAGRARTTQAQGAAVS